MKESYLNEGIIKDVSGPTMASIFDFMYTSNTILTHDNVYDVLEASEYLLIPSWYYIMTQLCITYLDSILFSLSVNLIPTSCIILHHENVLDALDYFCIPDQYPMIAVVHICLSIKFKTCTTCYFDVLLIDEFIVCVN